MNVDLAEETLCLVRQLVKRKGMKDVEQRKLIVEESIKGDVYKDIARIHWRERGKRSRIGAIVAISVDRGPRHFFSLRGLPDEDAGKIRFDHVARSELRLKVGEEHNIAIEETNPWEKLVWAVHATDPVARIATWIAIWSGIVAILGLVIAGIGAWPVVRDWVMPQKAEHQTPAYSPSPSEH